MARARPHALRTRVPKARVPKARVPKARVPRVLLNGHGLVIVAVPPAKVRALAIAAVSVATAHARDHALAIVIGIAAMGHGSVAVASVAVGAIHAGARCAHSVSITSSRSTTRMSRVCIAISRIAPRSSHGVRLESAHATSVAWGSRSRTRDIWRCCPTRRRSDVAPDVLVNKWGRSVTRRPFCRT